MKSERLTLIAGFGLLVPALFWLLSKNDPTILYPFPALVLIPALFGLSVAAIVVPMLFFFIWNPGLLQGDIKLPRRSYFLLAVATCLSFFWFAIGWKDGLHFQGSRYTYSVSVINVG